MRRIADIIYLITKPFILFELLLLIINLVVRPILFKSLSKTLVYDRITKKVAMDIPPCTLVKYWFSGKNRDDMAIELEDTFFEGLIKLKEVYGTNKEFKTDVYSAFFRLMKLKATELNVSFNYEIIEKISTRQITARLMLISPFHFWCYLFSSMLGNKESRKRLKSIFKVVKVYKVTFKFN
ncbi:hypothetical protein ACZ11_03165 [Lysinibacillus xylanilyticus]|uniref:Uncharacterized protein n=1 Tax=Lysinibacillus xylanilyticus TaxID=582475 RepID=A0A0K9FAL9_9BACI|nr:hypothetical protein [Lysinibacillus xylanilyticus]KMY31277.1 hypothetical protein ACZ11_03165 [Lysinibacillus xylanilyticus]